MRFKILVVGVNFAPIRVAHPQRLHCGDEDASMGLQVGWRNLSEISNIEHPKSPIECRAERLIVWVARPRERFECLGANGVSRHQPKHDRKFALKISVCRYFYRVSRKQRLAAASRQAQADVGDRFETFERPKGAGFANADLVHLVESGLSPHDTSGVKIGFQNRQGLSLIFFEGKHRYLAFKSYGVCLKIMLRSLRRDALIRQASPKITFCPSCLGSSFKTLAVKTLPPSGRLSPRIPL